MYRIPSLLIPVAYLPGLLYQKAIRLRNRAYSRKWLTQRRLSAPVISVGNLTMGGTGKTPFVIYLAGLIEALGYETAILTRGYGRRKPGATVILRPGETGITPMIGDEPALTRRRLPQTWMGISANRFQAGTAIAQQATSPVFILDDGFQHRSLFRNLDIVMIDSTQPPDGERLFPLGALREPIAELRRANIIIVNGDEAATVEKSLRPYAGDNAVFFQCVQRIGALIPFTSWQTAGQNATKLSDVNLQNKSIAAERAQNTLGVEPTDENPQTDASFPRPKSVYPVAAIGNPERFLSDIARLGIAAPGFRFFRDHAEISRKAWTECRDHARKLGAEAIVMTEKDAVKFSVTPDFPVLVAIQSTELSDEHRFREILKKLLF